ncbi:MAG: hypothetical protein ACI95C_000182 [Pseudohongiellaceae bacterium]|jgi:hypothetical protein
MSKEKSARKPIDLSIVESRTTINGLLAPFILGLNFIGVVCCGYVFFALSFTLNDLSGADLIEAVKEDFSVFQQLDVGTRKSADEIALLSSTLDTKLNERSVLDATEAMQETERNAQLFMRLLKVNLYNLTSYVPGIASWYEMHSPAIDLAIERSRSRQLKLLQIRAMYESDA